MTTGPLGLIAQENSIDRQWWGSLRMRLFTVDPDIIS
jgi:hypothetical protein